MVELWARWCRRTQPRSWSTSDSRAGAHGVTPRGILRCQNIAEVLSEIVRLPLDPRSILIGDSTDRSINHVKAVVRIVFVQPHLEVSSIRGVRAARHVPLDVENAVRGDTGGRGEDTAPIRPSRATCLADRGTPLMSKMSRQFRD